MTLLDLAIPVIGALAFVGYVTCLLRFVWLTGVGTLGFAAVAYLLHPVGSGTHVYWGMAGAGLILALGSAWFFRPSHLALASSEKPTDGSQIVIDGTNVLYWDGDGAQMATLRIVIDALKKKGRSPIVFLDASSRHHLGDKGLNEQGFAKALGVPKSQVMVCPARTEADAFILKYARAENLPVVSNDMFRDRAAQTKGLKFVKGVIVKGRPIFDGL
jgi:hypothetical protein